MAGLVTYCIKMILKIILYFLRSKYNKVSGTAISKHPGSSDRRRTSSPVEEHPRRDVNFSNEVSSVHSEISNGTGLEDYEWGTFAEYDVPGEEQDLDLEEQKQLLERLREENRRLHLEVMKKNRDEFDHMCGGVSRSINVQPSTMTRRRTFLSVEDVFTARDTDEREVEKVDFGAPLLQTTDVLPLKLTRRRRSMFLSVDDVSTVSDTDVDEVSKITKWPSLDALSHIHTMRTRWVSLGVSDVSAARYQDERKDEEIQQIPRDKGHPEDERVGGKIQQISDTDARGHPEDERVTGKIQQISDTDAKGHRGVDRRNQTEGKNIGDLVRILKRQQYENSHLKMYINSFMDKIITQQPSLLER